MHIERRSRALSVVVEGEREGVAVTLDDGRVVRGSHCLMAVGAIPNAVDLGLSESGVGDDGIPDTSAWTRVSRTTSYRIYAAGDCTGCCRWRRLRRNEGVSWHALGDSLDPLDPGDVASAGVHLARGGDCPVPQKRRRRASWNPENPGNQLPLARNPRAKMQGVEHGFVKIIASMAGVVIGGVVVGATCVGSHLSRSRWRCAAA